MFLISDICYFNIQGLSLFETIVDSANKNDNNNSSKIGRKQASFIGGYRHWADRFVTKRLKSLFNQLLITIMYVWKALIKTERLLVIVSFRYRRACNERKLPGTSTRLDLFVFIACEIHMPLSETMR